jgi:hypothetical protein
MGVIVMLVKLVNLGRATGELEIMGGGVGERGGGNHIRKDALTLSSETSLCW